jgi:NAD(P)-dependent dehydrogenase (short-subunit alcohol dehydrogenase family)
MQMTASQQRVVLVTGASSGLGRSCAEFLAARNFRVYGASRRPQPSSSFESLCMDVREEASAQDVITGIIKREGRIDVVVNNAGIAIAGAVEDTSIEEAREQFDTNFFGVLRVCRAVLPVMREQQSGYIVNISSIGGLVAIPYQGLYSASKFALEGLSESLRLEATRFGIRVILIEPGDHRTALTQNRRRTADSLTNPIYRAKFDRAVATMEADEQHGTEPEAVARLLYRIINRSRPRLRYNVGPAPERAAVWLKRLMPYAIVEKVMGFYYSR